MINKNRIIGVIGGMGPQASCELYRLLIEGARHQYSAKNNNDYPEVLIDSVPVPDFIADTQKLDEAARILEDRVRRMTAYGISCVTIACNTACILNSRLQKNTNKPVISIIDEVVKKVARKSKKVLLLASPTSLRAEIYQMALESSDISFVVPEEKDLKKLENIIRGILGDGKRDILKQKLIHLAERYMNDSIDGIVLGCTELPLIFPSSYRIPVYNSLSILADSLLKRYYTKEDYDR